MFVSLKSKGVQLRNHFEKPKLLLRNFNTIHPLTAFDFMPCLVANGIFGCILLYIYIYIYIYIKGLVAIATSPFSDSYKIKM
jgi:hypothetical protein